jgi:hypothetical protein
MSAVQFLFVLLALAAPALAQPSITTAQYDNTRVGANLHESILTPKNVNAATFGKLFTMPVDGDVYAQPLYVPKLQIPGEGVRDVVFIATERNSVYAFDAKEPGAPLWHVSFINPAAGVNPVRWSDVQCSFIGPDIGITATPAIDLASRTMYLVARTRERSAGGQELFYQRLHALDIVTGKERAGSPVLIRATVSGSAWFGLTQREVQFNALVENPRAALLLSNGVLYIAWGSSCDHGSYYGWVLAYDARTLQQAGAFNTAPDAGEGGIWQSDAGLAADGDGNIYAVTGNGKFNASSGGRDYGDSVLKLNLQGRRFAVRDYFTPFNQSRLNWNDDDLGSCGPVLLPDQPGARRRLLIAAGKNGVLYLIDRDRMGGYHSGSDSHAVESFKVVDSAIYGAPAYWNGHLFVFASNDVLKDFPIMNGHLATTPAHRGNIQFKNPGAIPSISSNGQRDGIVWIVLTKDYREKDVSATLQAYEASDISHLLFTTEHHAENTPGLALRFTIASVVNGRVYVGSRNMVYVFGLFDSRKRKQF